MTQPLEWVEQTEEGRKAYKAIPHLWDRFTGDLDWREKTVALYIVDELLWLPGPNWYDFDVHDMATSLAERNGGYEEAWAGHIERVVDYAEATMLPMATVHEDRRGRGRKALDLVHDGKVFVPGTRWRAKETGELLAVSLTLGALSRRILTEEMR